MCGMSPGNRLRDKSRLSGVISCARLKEGTAVSVNSFTVNNDSSTANTKTDVNGFCSAQVTVENLRGYPMTGS